MTSGNCDCDCNEDDEVNHPAHYTSGPIEVIDIIEQIVSTYDDPKIGWNVGQIIKYLARAPLKGRLEVDLEKANWYMNRALSHAQTEEMELMELALGTTVSDVETVSSNETDIPNIEEYHMMRKLEDYWGA